MPRESGTVIPASSGPGKGGAPAAGGGWWAKLDPRKKRIVAVGAVGGGLALVYVLSQRNQPVDIPADTGDTGTDPYAPTDGAAASGVPGAWDYAGAGGPYYQAPMPPAGKVGSGGRLAYQIALLRKEWEAWLKHQGPDLHGPPKHKPPHHKPPHHKPPPHHHGHHHQHGHGGPGGPGGRGHGPHPGHHHHPHGR